MRDVPNQINESPDSSVRRAILRTQGYYIGPPLLSIETCAQLRQDIRRCIELSKGVPAQDSIRVVSVLQDSDSALSLVDDAQLGSLVDEVIGADAILGRLEGFQGAISEWERDFRRIRLVVPPRSCRAGVSLWIPLEVAEVQVLPGSQHLEEGLDPAAAWFEPVTLAAAQGSALVFEGGVCYRLCQPGEWLRLSFVRPWIKPDVFYSTALSSDRVQRLGTRGKNWCGVELGLPTSVEAFLAIENATLNNTVARAKGSGI